MGNERRNGERPGGFVKIRHKGAAHSNIRLLGVVAQLGRASRPGRFRVGEIQAQSRMQRLLCDACRY